MSNFCSTQSQISILCLSMLNEFCYHNMAHLRAMDGDDSLKICTVTARVLNKLSQRPDKDWPSAWGLGSVNNCYETLQKNSKLEVNI